MSRYTGFATQRGFGANLIQVPDPSEKIRKKGLRALEWDKEALAYINKQADRISSQFDSNNALEAKLEAQKAQDRKFYADTLASAKWKNFEIQVKNAQRKQKSDNSLNQILALTQTGAKLIKDIDTARKTSIDKYADEIYLDFGIGTAEVQAIQNAAKTGRLDQVIKQGASLQGLLRELEIDANTPLDVLQRISRTNGYLPVAVQKLSAIRFGQQLPMRVAQKLNEEIDLPGVPTGVTYNTAKNPALREQILNKIISTELTNPDTGEKLFSNNVLQISGLIGPDGTISKTKAAILGASAEKDAKEYWSDRHIETIRTIQSFIGPGSNGGGIVGATGIQEAIFYFAGGEDASREALSASREKVVDAIIDGLKEGDFVWSEIEDLGNLPVVQRGSNKEQKWGELFRREWDAIQDAGKASAKDAADDFELRLESAKAEAREAEINVDELIATGNPSIETLAKLHGEFASRGVPFQNVAQKVATAMQRGRTNANDKAGTAVLLARAQKGERITDEEINAWNFSIGVGEEVRARAAQHNKLLPTQGDNGTYERLEFRIESELQSIIEQRSGWQKNQTHNDAKIAALNQASVYYKAYMDKDFNHEEAYKATVDLITKDIRDPEGRWGAVDTRDGLQGFRDFVANTERKHKEIEPNHEQWGQELTANPNLIYKKQYVSDSVTESFASKINAGYTIALPQSTMLIQSLTRGSISAIDAMVAQVERLRNAEIAENGSTDIQSIPDSYIKLYKKEEERIPRGLSRYLSDMNPVGPNRAYTGAGYQPPNQEHYYKRIRPLVSVGNPNAIAGDDLVLKNSKETLGANITNATIRQVLAMMANGHFSSAGDGQWDSQRLQAAVEAAGLPLETKFSVSTQQKLLDVTIKNFGVAGFPHKMLDEDAISLIEEIKVNLNQEELPTNYWRSKAACNDKACAYMKQEGISYGE